MSIRSRVLRPFATALGGLAFLGLTLGACDQGVGERCQRNEDCASGLTCNLGTQLCQAGVVGIGDAAVDTPLDAELDAGPDAAVDATLDAAPALR